MKDLLQALQTLGLTEIEAKVYLTLLKHKNMTAVGLAKETGIHRRTIYDNLDLLIQKGFVSFRLIDGTKYFNANHPNALKEFIGEKQFILNSVFPKLTKWYKNPEESPKINILVGKTAAKTIIENAVQKGKDVYWLGGGLHLIESFGFSAYLKEKFSKLKIKLLQPKIKGLEKRLKFLKNKKVRFLPKKFESSVGFVICGNTLGIGQLKDDNIISIIIESKDFAAAFKNYFDFIWKFSSKN